MDVKEIQKAVDDVLVFLTKKDKYEILADKLKVELLNGWDTETNAAISSALVELEKGKGEFGGKDVKGIMKAIDKKLGNSRLAVILESKLEEVQKETYETAVGQVITEYAFGKTDYQLLEWLKEDSTYWIGSYYDREVQDLLRTEIKAIAEQGLSRYEAGQLLQKTLGDRFGKSVSYWEAMSNHVVTRTREFGKVEAYQKGAIEFVQIKAVLDMRTSPVCRELHNKIIPVKSLADQRSKIMSAKNPAAVKKVAPFLKLADIAGLSNDQLADKGIGMPPYHWNCRTLTVAYFGEEET